MKIGSCNCPLCHKLFLSKEEMHEHYTREFLAEREFALAVKLGAPAPYLSKKEVHHESHPVSDAPHGSDDLRHRPTDGNGRLHEADCGDRERPDLQRLSWYSIPKVRPSTH